MRAIAIALLFGLFNSVSAADLAGEQPDLVPVKPVRITAYRQLTGNGWSNNANPRYNNANTAGQPKSVVGALQNVGGALLEGAQSGFQETGRRIGNAGQDLGNAVNELSGGTIGRVNDGIRQSFDNASQTARNTANGWTNTTVGNQPASNRAAPTNAQTAYAPATSVRPPQLQITRSQLTQSTPRNNATTGGYSAPPLAGTNAAGANNPSGGLNDPGQSPFAGNNQGSVLNFPSDQNNNAGHDPGNVQQPNTPTNNAQTANTWRGSNTGTNRYNDMVNVSPVGNDAFRTNNSRVNNQSNANPPFASNSNQNNNNTIRNTPTNTSPWYNGGSGATINSQTPVSTDNQSPFYRGNTVSNNTTPNNAFPNNTNSNNTSQGYRPQTTGYANQPNTPGYNTRSSNPYARANSNQAASNQAANNQAANNQGSPMPESKWLPLMMTGVALMGSIGANLFLGFGYLDARHKYLSTIRRGSRSFSRTDEIRAA